MARCHTSVTLSVKQQVVELSLASPGKLRTLSTENGGAQKAQSRKDRDAHQLVLRFHD
jgi:hypothetical protein